MNEQEIEKFKMKYEERIFHLKMKLKVKDLDLKLAKDSVQMYEEEIQHLRDIIKSEVMNAEIE